MPITKLTPLLDTAAHNALLRRLTALAPLSDAEIAVLESLCSAAERLPSRAEILSEGEAITRPVALVSGWACRLRILPDGRRQILDFLVPGDLIGMSRGPKPLALASVLTLTDVALADATALRDAVDGCAAFPQLATACHLSQSLREARLLDHLVRLGRQTAYERVAHLFLELLDRLRDAGLASGNRFPMPLTQETLADALGLSIVHVNRTLQQLRREELIETRGGAVILLQPETLAMIADYRPHKVSAQTTRNAAR